MTLVACEVGVRFRGGPEILHGPFESAGPLHIQRMTPGRSPLGVHRAPSHRIHSQLQIRIRKDRPMKRRTLIALSAVFVPPTPLFLISSPPPPRFAPQHHPGKGARQEPP